MKAPVGFIVLTEEYGTWAAVDGLIYGDVDTGALFVRNLRALGCRAVLAALVPVPGPAGDPDGDLGGEA